MVDDAEAAEEDEEEDEAAGYRIKNKKPTQRCGFHHPNDHNDIPFLSKKIHDSTICGG